MGTRDLAGLARGWKRLAPPSVTFTGGDAPQVVDQAQPQDAGGVEPPLLTMAEAEWDHEAYFRSRVTSHAMSRLVRVWPAPPPREEIRRGFATSDPSDPAGFVWRVRSVEGDASERAAE